MGDPNNDYFCHSPSHSLRSTLEPSIFGNAVGPLRGGGVIAAGYATTRSANLCGVCASGLANRKLGVAKISRRLTAPRNRPTRHNVQARRSTKPFLMTRRSQDLSTKSVGVCMSRNAFPAALELSIGCSVALSVTPAARNSWTMSWDWGSRGDDLSVKHRNTFYTFCRCRRDRGRFDQVWLPATGLSSGLGTAIQSPQ
jgi:hypothetical protein